MRETGPPSAGRASVAEEGFRSSERVADAGDSFHSATGASQDDSTRFEQIEPGDTVAPRIDAPLPEQLLQPGELVHMLLKPSPLYIVLEPAMALALLALGVWLIHGAAPLLGVTLAPHEVLFPAVVLALGTLLLAAFDWITRFYMITNRRVIGVTAIGRPRVREIGLHQVAGVAVTAQLRERSCGLATLRFQSDVDGHAPVVWRMVSRPEEVRDVVARLMRRR